MLMEFDLKTIHMTPRSHL